MNRIFRFLLLPQNNFPYTVSKRRDALLGRSRIRIRGHIVFCLSSNPICKVIVPVPEFLVILSESGASYMLSYLIGQCLEEEPVPFLLGVLELGMSFPHQY
jgi:hypothetical protein